MPKLSLSSVENSDKNVDADTAGSPGAAREHALIASSPDEFAGETSLQVSQDAPCKVFSLCTAAAAAAAAASGRVADPVANLACTRVLRVSVHECVLALCKECTHVCSLVRQVISLGSGVRV